MTASSIVYPHELAAPSRPSSASCARADQGRIEEWLPVRKVQSIVAATLSWSSASLLSLSCVLACSGDSRAPAEDAASPARDSAAQVHDATSAPSEPVDAGMMTDDPTAPTAGSGQYVPPGPAFEAE